MDQNQQDALKRKFDQTMEQTRRSLEAVETHRRNLIDNELILLYSALDLKNLIDSLVNDQEVLFQHLCELKSMKDKTKVINDQINRIEDDLEMRGAQIVEMSSKQEDLEEKVRKMSESFKTIPELRTAIAHLLNKLLETRNTLTTRLAQADVQIEQLMAENLELKKQKSKPEVIKKVHNRERKSDVETYSEEFMNESGINKSDDPDFSPKSCTKKMKIQCKCKTNCLRNFCICKRYGSYCTACQCTQCLNFEPKSNDDAELKANEQVEFQVPETEKVNELNNNAEA